MYIICDINVQWVKEKEEKLHANTRIYNGIDTKKIEGKQSALQILYRNLLNNFIMNSVFCCNKLQILSHSLC